jgi:hypothetical protein
MSEKATSGPRVRSQVLRAAILVYTTLAVGVLCIPTSLSDWADQLGWQRGRAVLLPVANGMVLISKFCGLDRPYSAARQFFLSTTGKAERDTP